jgi:hypothetical protein
MEDTIAENRNKAPQPQAVRPANPVKPMQAPVPQQPVVQAKKPVVAPKPVKEEEEFDLEKLMMQELLSRSQEEPKEEKVEEKPAPEAVSVVVE